MKTYTLFELNEYIRRIIALNFTEGIWVSCEIAQLRDARSHLFLSLVEKGDDVEGIIAQSDAVIWASTHKALRRKRGLLFDTILREGVEVLVKVTVDFHERYGLKLIIQDIDPAYTLGQLELKRRETIKELKALDLLHKNQTTDLPLAFQRIAIVSSEGAAGLQDYLSQLSNNPYGYRFTNQLFNASVQGNAAVKEMLQQLKRIRRSIRPFDAVVIIRGGGAKLDLAAFDDLELCKAVAEFPLPVLVGVGHDVDETVIDLVCHSSLKTPTAVADFVINHNMYFETRLIEQANELRDLALFKIRDEQMGLERIQQFVQYQATNTLKSASQELNFIERKFPLLLQQIYKTEEQKLDSIERVCAVLNPKAILKRGYSLTTHKNKIVVDASILKDGDEIETQLHKGTIKSIVDNGSKKK